MPATLATGESGFTLLELLVVLAVMVLMGMTWPLTSSHVFAAQHLRNETQLLAGALRAAEMQARATGKPGILQISPGGDAYRIGAQAHELPMGMQLQLRGGPVERAPTALEVFPDGSSTGATLDLTLHERVSVIEVRPMTGQLEVTP